MTQSYDDDISQLKTDEEFGRDVYIDADPDGPLAPHKSEENYTNNALAHLSSLLTGFVLGMPFIGPIICWMIWKDDHPNTMTHVKEALNFTLSMLILIVIMIPMAFAGFFGLLMAVESPNPTMGWILGILGVIGFVGILVISLMSLILPIVAAYKASKGNFFRYPLTKRFFS